MLTLHLAPGTIALASHAALEEAGADYALHWIDFATGEQTSQSYLAINPKGRVPALVTDHGTLTETIAILEWIAAGHPQAALMPDDPWRAARAREVMTFLASTMHVAHAHKLRGHRWSDDPAAHESMRAKVAENMATCAGLLESNLEGDWILGDRFSVADLYVWTVVRWLDGDGVPLAGYPRLSAHSARVAARPAVARVLPHHM
ncbi:glutathione S-transferase [Jannaschia pagri]|uniref:Glutathione S-transferase n=1 Tax=Jannaschia pagri TaxID=2829797 RepID=A0ABQ4NPH0_9RHOB|nr:MULTISPECIES: glutathione S-transferase family protein [unclassified Jannaschia]GIT92473.1 glutathione S-transferase [Jannaschia sp. AI_61]GIT96308.1 glutathione S-transferase [Jannaschia sp. AI_62]